MNRNLVSGVLALLLLLAACGSSTDTSTDDWVNDTADSDRSGSTATTWATTTDNTMAAETPGDEASPAVGRDSDGRTTDGVVEAEDAYDDVEFQEEDPNPAVDPIRDNLSTFALDVDTGSYTIGQRFLDDGFLPTPDTVRVEEYVNALDYHYPAPERDDDFAIHLMGGNTPFVDSREAALLQIGIQAYDVSDDERPPANLTFVIDVSGSMSQDNKLETVKEALTVLVDNLENDDQVAIVAYDTRADVILEPTSVRDADEIIRAIERLRTGGSTNAEAGLVLGYQLAEEAFDRRAINRVILASDGVANVGATGPDAILESISEAAGDGINLVTVGVGMGTYNDVLLEQLADNGDGFYAYVNSFDEIRDLFVDDLTGTLYTVAKDARVQVDFNADAVLSYRLLGYENREIADRDFRNDEVDAGEIGAGHSVTAIYEVILTDDASRRDEIATVSLRWLNPRSERATEMSASIDVGDLVGDFDEAPRAFKAATTVATFAEALRESRFGRDIDLGDLVDLADDVARELDDAAFDDFSDMVYDASRLDR